MTERDYWNRVNEEGELPQVVLDKAQAAFAQIKKAETESEAQKNAEQTSAVRRRSGVESDRRSVRRAGIRYAGGSDGRTGRRSFSRKVMAASLAAAALLGLGAGAAGLIRWRHSTQRVYFITDKDKNYAEENGLVASPDLDMSQQTSVTAEGITVSAVQTLVDEHSGYVCFKVSGIDADSEIAPYFNNMSLWIDGEKSDDLVWSGSFYNGWIPTDDGYAVQEDGSLITDSTKEKYLLDDGSYEYNMYFHIPFGEEETLPGKTIHAKFEDIGLYDTGKKLEGSIKRTGTWELSWTLNGTDDVKIADISEERGTLGDTGAVVTSAKITPITLSATYDWPRQTVTSETQDIDGNTITFEEQVEPPRLLGVRLKDGRLLRNIGSAGSVGYKTDDENDTAYQVFWQTNRILNPEEIDALLFYKHNWEEEKELTEDDFYVVPLP